MELGPMAADSEVASICRSCLRTTTQFAALSDTVNIQDCSLLFADLLLTCANIQISLCDEFPQILCETCQKTAITCYNFRIQCEKSNKRLRTASFRRLSAECYKKNEAKCIGSRSCEEVSQIAEVGPDCRAICNKSNAKTQFSEHVASLKTSRKRSNPKRSKERISAVDVKRRTCPECGKIFEYRGSMLKHHRKHKSPPSTCSYCPFKPVNSAKLFKHMEEVHAHLKTLICSTCGKAFFKLKNLRLHMVTHSGIKKHTCEICGMSFALGSNLSQHRRLHTGEKPYACSQCDRAFAQQSTLRSHEAGHSNRRDHVCQECGAAFSRAGALQNHRKRHSGLKPFECSMCGKSFTFSSERKRHMTTHTGDRNHVCEMCGKRFNRASNLKVHKRIHTGETPYVCAVCGKGFIQAHCLRTHANTHMIKSVKLEDGAVS